MSEQDLELLDFPRVCELVAGYCRTSMGRERMLGTVPWSDPETVKAEYDRVFELIELSAEPLIGSVPDVRKEVARAGQESVLTGPELLSVRRACVGIRECRQFLYRRRERLPAVWQVTEPLCELPDLEQELDAALDDSGEVRDSATPLLERTRRELRRRRNRLVERLETMVSEHPDWFTDRPTVRRDRFVLPLKLESREKLAGVIHESSGSGHTLFVEPMETVEEQNKLAELRGVETGETARVLRRLSAFVAAYAAPLEAAMEVVGKLDSLLAKARYGREFDCCRPAISTDGNLELVAGRHPLLLARRKLDVVPLYFRLPDGATVVLVSGPNAGGKTVAIKTLGIMCLMLGCGIPLPAAEGTKLPLFRQVFADIGDEQSLDDDLSSFTGHVSHLKRILGQSDAHSLVLLDEIGSSTAPEEGAALAVAVLETLRDRGVTTVATSHFGVLKLFVQDERGMVNAAMGFRDGRPTFRLTFGFPGESSALEIAASVGLDPGLIRRAESRLGREWLDMSAKLRALDLELEKARAARRAAEEERRKGEETRAVHEARLAELKEKLEAEREQLQAEREAALLAARREIENLVRRIRETQAEHKAVVKAKKYVEDELHKAQGAGSKAQEHDAESDFAEGDAVESKSLRRRGVVTEVGPDAVTVAFGSIKMQMKHEDLSRDMTESFDNSGRATAPAADDTGRFDTRLSLLGMSREEAAAAIDKFLDEAACLGARQVWLVHGKGTGVLKQMVRTALRKDPRVETFRLGEPFEGGDGVTVVTMRTEVAGCSLKVTGKARTR